MLTKMRLFIFLFASLAISIGLVGCGNNPNGDDEYLSDIRLCNTSYASVIDKFWARKQCIDDAERNLNTRIKEKARTKKENEARECLASNIPTYEKLLSKKSKELSMTTKLEDAVKIYSNDFSAESTLSVSIPKENIAEKVIIANIKTVCESSFYFLVNIRYSEAGDVKWLGVWAKNPPIGYKNIESTGYVVSLSRDFDREKFDAEQLIRQRIEEEQEAKRRDERLRQEQIEREQAAKRRDELLLQEQVERESKARAIEQARNAQIAQAAEKAALLDRLRRDIYMTVKEVKCYRILNNNKDDCSDYSLSVTLTNRSSYVVNSLGYSVYWTPIYNECKVSAQNIVSNSLRLIPNETRESTVGLSGYGSLPKGPSTSGMKICVFLTSANP